MIAIFPFAMDDLLQLDAQDNQCAAVAFARGLPAQNFVEVEAMSSYTIRYGDRVLACGGVFELTPWRGLSWILLGRDLGHKFIYVHRASLRLYAAVPYPRIEAEIDYEFEEGHRWARLQGFEMETARVRKYREDGGDITRYVMVR